jgi:hypothetical protein
VIIGRRWAVLIVTLASSVGCGGGGARRYEVSGTVTFKGSPVPAGTVLFEPDTAKGNKGPGSSTDIVNGHYRVISSNGVVGGHYLVRITGFDGKGDDRGEAQRGRQLFPEHVQKIELPFADGTHNIVVNADAK